VKFHVTRHWLKLANQWLEVTRQFLWLDSDSTKSWLDSNSTRKIFRWLWLYTDSKGLWLWLNINGSSTSLLNTHQSSPYQLMCRSNQSKYRSSYFRDRPICFLPVWYWFQHLICVSIRREHVGFKFLEAKVVWWVFYMFFLYQKWRIEPWSVCSLNVVLLCILASNQF